MEPAKARSQVNSHNFEDPNGKPSENEMYDSVGATLSDGIKKMKMLPFHEVDASNRRDFWKLYLEGLGGDVIYINAKQAEDDETPKVAEEKNVIRKIEISTFINSDSELYTTKLDLENQATVSLDIDRTRNSLKHCKHKAEKMLTLFCKSHNHTYKQGLNEVISLFLL